MRARYDQWEGSLNAGDELDVTTTEELDDAIGALDGWTRAQVSLQALEDTLLAIGGGRGSFFVQFLLPEDGGEWLLVEGDLDCEVELAIGRQSAPYPRRNLVGSSRASTVARYFLMSAARDPSLEQGQSY